MKTNWKKFWYFRMQNKQNGHSFDNSNENKDNDEKNLLLAVCYLLSETNNHIA